MYPVSISFGVIPSGQTHTFDVVLINLIDAGATFDVAVGGGDSDMSYFVSPVSLLLDAGKSGTMSVTMSAAKGAEFGDYSDGWLDAIYILFI